VRAVGCTRRFNLTRPFRKHLRSHFLFQEIQKRAFDETKVLRTKGLERRADNLPPADQRRMAWVFSANDRFANSFGEGVPLRSTPFSNDEFQAAAQMR